VVVGSASTATVQNGFKQKKNDDSVRMLVATALLVDDERLRWDGMNIYDVRNTESTAHHSDDKETK
jgi:hypothetical protein